MTTSNISTNDVDVLVVGAGLAGLRCAGVLATAGRDVAVWEADDDVGGRLRTDLIDGFRCDRGFAVLNPAYPELSRAVDVDALRLQPFGAGVAVRREHDATVWVHPLRNPARVPKMLASGGIRPRDLVAVARWALPALRPAVLTSQRQPDSSLGAALRRSKVSGELGRVLERFLAGVLLDDTGSSSNSFTLLLARMFLLGVPALPADGMQALPRALADGLADRIALNRNVIGIERDGRRWRVLAADGAETRAAHVVIAADPVTAAVLTGEPSPPMHGVVTDWWTPDVAPPSLPMLWVDGRPRPGGPVLNAAVVDAAAPSYVPAGRHLIVASALLKDGVAPEESTTRRHAGEILGIATDGWKLLSRNVIRHALPAQPPPLRTRRPVLLSSGMWVCGDHRDTASIQGALVSGRRTAEGILQAASSTMPRR